MRTCLPLFVALLLEPAGAQRPAPQKPSEKCSVEGIVVKAATSEPLKKAHVALEKAEERASMIAALTDADGRFRLTDLEPGRYHLSVERNGYLQQEYGQRGPGRPGSILTLEPGQAVGDLVFKMIPAAVIAGRVFDEDGEALPGEEVMALRSVYREGRKQLVVAGSVQTSDLGEYRIWGLLPGLYFLSAKLSRGMRMATAGVLQLPGDGGQEEGYAPTYYPGTSDPARAGVLELRPGDELRAVDLSLVPTRAVRIRGRVFNSVLGQPGRGAMLHLTQRGIGIRAMFYRDQVSVQDPEGKFELRGVTPGSYTLTASWWGDGKIYATRVPVDVGNVNLEGLSLFIAPGADVNGRVRVEGSGELNLTDLRIWLGPDDDSPTFASTGGSVKPDGTFVIHNVPAGPYHVSVYGFPATFYLKAAHAGTDNVLEGGLTVVPGKETATLEVVISAGGGVVDGLVLNAEGLPVSGAVVVLVPGPQRRAQSYWYKTTTTDQYGRFVLKGVAPGEYKLFAWEDVEAGAYMDPDFLPPIEKQGQSVVMEEGGRHTLELKVIPAERKQP